MTIRTLAKFTPEALLSAPRRSSGVPNSDGSKLLFSVSTYSFEDHKQNAEIRMLDMKTGESSFVEDGARCSNPVWVDDEFIALLKSTDDQRTELLIGSHGSFKKDCYVAGTIDAPASNLKIKKLDNGTYGVAVTAAANPDGSLYSPAKAKKPRSTGRLYRSLFVRHWDAWITPQRNSIWYGALSITRGDAQSAKSPRYVLSDLQNALRGTFLESPIPPFGGSGHFDISKSGLIFVAKDPSIDPAVNTRCMAYLLSLTDFRDTAPALFELMPPPIMQGAMTSPVFSKDGSKVAFLMMRENGYESDKNELLVMPDVRTPGWLIHMLARDSDVGVWDRSPSSVSWSEDGSRLYLTAENEGEVQVFTLSADPRIQQAPMQVTSINGAVDDVKVLSSRSEEHRLFISNTSFVENSSYLLVRITYHGDADQISCTTTKQQISELSGNGAKLGLKMSQVSEIRSPRAAKTSQPPQGVHSWVIKPSNFDRKKKYPLAFLIHGGPQGAWANQWSTRWNPAVFAEQGYVVICPNPTGSTGYGQDFTDAIKEQWGGLPYEDLVNCFEYIETELEYVDTNRAVALGGSYGGYMVNWIQGHPLGRKFKALMTHDGVFSTPYELATDELYFAHREFGGEWSANRPKYMKWSPDQFTQHWKTPHLIIHSEKDYRLTISDGLAAFNILQVQGVESELLTFPDENHWVLNPENSLVWHETVFNFINKYVGLPPFSKGDEKGIIQDPQMWKVVAATAKATAMPAR